MAKPEPAWVAKWRELERLVDKKYEGYISIVGLQMHQFNEPGSRHFHIDLTVHPCEIYIGGGSSRLEAITMAIRTVRDDSELEQSSTIFTKKMARGNEAETLYTAINNCEFKKSAQ